MLLLVYLLLVPSVSSLALFAIKPRPMKYLTAAAVWDPVQQIYVGGGVPNHNDQAVDEYLKEDTLRIFGYGSLCWGPGTGALARDGVTTKLGRAIGYKRCWAQKSTDHRGVPQFPGLVCTLLTDYEIREISSHRQAMGEKLKPSMAEGVVYTIPPEQVEECLAELDFREKGVSCEPFPRTTLVEMLSHGSRLGLRS
jgi:cation transport regulator ChaC